jgi:hypothetical protein
MGASKSKDKGKSMDASNNRSTIGDTPATAWVQATTRTRARTAERPAIKFLKI